MAGLLTPNFLQLPKFGGSEQFPLDTETTRGGNPESAMTTLMALAAAVSLFSNSASLTPVAGRRYFSSVTFGYQNVVTGLMVLVGSVGGTDNWIFGLHDGNGVQVATTAPAGTTAGTAGSFQQLAFTTPYTAIAGTYYVAVQSNGTTAKIGTYNAPIAPLSTGSSPGSFGVTGSLVIPSTYTPGVGPVGLAY